MRTLTMAQLDSAKQPGAPRAATRAHKYRLPILDGLRGVGIIVVILYHLGYSQVRHAWLCISLFFSMSGLVITGTTVESFELRGTVDVVGFWSRRVARLFPALFLVLVLCAVSRFFRAEDTTEIQLWYEWSDLMWALVYLANVNLAFFRKDDYFAATLKPSIARHLWTLSIEEQYYIVWPLLFALWSRIGFWCENIRARRSKTLALPEPLMDVESKSRHSSLKEGDKCGHPAGTGKALSGRLNTCLKALLVGDCIVIALSYFSSLWTIEELGLSAAYYSTWCRAGDFACGGLVYILVRLNPSIYQRYSHRQGVSTMSTPCRILLEMGSATALAMVVLPPMIQAPLQDALYGYFYVFRIPFGFITMAATVFGAMQLSEPLPKWAVATRILSSKLMTKLGVASYGIYLIHWPLIVRLGNTAHESLGAAMPGANGTVYNEEVAGSFPAAFAGLQWSSRELHNLVIMVLSIGLGMASFLLYEMPLLLYVMHVKRPWKVLAAGFLGTLITGAIVSACYIGVSNPNLINKDDIGSVYAAMPAEAVDPSTAKDERLTPVWLYSGPGKSPSRIKLSTILDEKMTPAERPQHLPAIDNDSSGPRKKEMQLLYETTPADAVVIMCDTRLQQSPCELGQWKEGVTWVWLSSQVICGQRKDEVIEEGQSTGPSHGITRLCPDKIRIATLRM